MQFDTTQSQFSCGKSKWPLGNTERLGCVLFFLFLTTEQLYTNSLFAALLKRVLKSYRVISNHLWGVSKRAVCDPLYYVFTSKIHDNKSTNTQKV